MNTRLPGTENTALPERLMRIEHARRAVLGEGHPSHSGSHWVEPWIDQSWRRCMAQGLHPQQALDFHTLSVPAIRRALEASEPLLQAAAPVIASLARTMADTHHFAILTNADGVVIDVNGPIDRHNPHAHLIARVGVDLSENTVGTTAIGACLAEQKPVWLHRGEHFFDDTSVYSCAGAPVFGPDGRCVGVLDLTGVMVNERPALRHLVAQSARRIENALTLSQPHSLLLRLNWPGSATESDSAGLVCVNSEGLVTGSNRAAADMLGLLPGMPGQHCNDLFAVPFQSLFDAARQEQAERELPLWSGLRLLVKVQLGGHRARPVAASPGQAAAKVPLKEVETALIRQAVQEARGNVMEAARALGISRATVYRKLMRKPTCDDKA